jgi:hypothetical protein
MWDNIEEALRGFLGWIVHHPIAALIILGAVLWFVARGFVLWVFGQILLFALLVWAILFITGYGRLWGVRKKKD